VPLYKTSRRICPVCKGRVRSVLVEGHLVLAEHDAMHAGRVDVCDGTFLSASSGIPIYSSHNRHKPLDS